MAAQGRADGIIVFARGTTKTAAESGAAPRAKGVETESGARPKKSVKRRVSEEFDQNSHHRSLLRQERSRNTRERLVRAALKLWRTQGFEDTTVDEIAAEARVAWSTFYYHFANKDDLLRELGGLTAQAVEKDLSFEPGARIPTSSPPSMPSWQAWRDT